MSFFADPRFIDLIMALVVLEAAGVLAFRLATGAGPRPAAFLFNLLSGGSLLLALREALAGASPTLIAGSLALALLAHVGDLALRWKVGQSTIGKQTAIAQASPKAAPSAPGRGSRVRA
ncbi:hypothetical protein AMST5_00015 [freshwater sediment metagenome]|jgi:hypothetical protein|uniref:Uncharacterized protein n=1 Tax=freshwater sediment metagenome TaxID=556182 RepID=A0AA48LWR1_9ZZZZ